MKKIIIALSLVLFPAISHAAAPACNAQSAGSVSCMANKQCECKFYRKSEMAGTPDRFDWDCGIMRPSCSGGANVNVTNTPAYNGPSSVGFSNSTSSTNVSQNPITTNTQVQSPELTQQQQSPTTTNTSTTTQTPTQSSVQTGTQSNNQNSTQNQ